MNRIAWLSGVADHFESGNVSLAAVAYLLSQHSLPDGTVSRQAVARLLEHSARETSVTLARLERAGWIQRLDYADGWKLRTRWSVARGQDAA
jgi:hypothetical protein